MNGGAVSWDPEQPSIPEQLVCEAFRGNPITTFVSGDTSGNVGTAASLTPAIVQMGMGPQRLMAGGQRHHGSESRGKGSHWQWARHLQERKR